MLGDPYNSGSFGGPMSQPRPPARFGNTPTRNLRRNVVNVFRLSVPNQDADGGIQNSWTLIASNLQCSIQPGRPARDETQGAIRQTVPYTILFDANPRLALGDQIQWIDDVGILHTINVTGCKNLAGRGAAFAANGEEVL
jgi:hypothetical protein